MERTTFLLCAWLSWVYPAMEVVDRDAEKRPDPSPFFILRSQQTEYAGPGREVPAPKKVTEVVIGYFGPSDRDNLLGGDQWCAAQMAIEEANQQGGYQGKPFRLVPCWSKDPWGTGVRDLVRVVYERSAWAIVGGIDGPSTHLAEQLVAKARLPLVSPASADKTVNLVNLPWMFSCVPGHHLQAPLLAAEIASRVGDNSFVIVSATDHDSHLFLQELTRSLEDYDLAPLFHFQFERGAGDLENTLQQLLRAEAEALVLIADPNDSAQVVSALRQAGSRLPVFGGPSMGRRTFLKEAGNSAEDVVFPLVYYRLPRSEDFYRSFQSRFDRAPDYAAAHTYDAVRLLVAAVRRAGLNRARIRDALVDLSPWAGVTGTIRWDPTGSNDRPVSLGTIRGGRIVPLANRQAQAVQTTGETPATQ
jgi:branched-chain amino acid transport system substrate-binding protein